MNLSKFIVNGQAGYYTSARIDRKLVPEGWNKYSITFSDEDPMDLANIQKHALCNHCYDFITKADFESEMSQNDGFVPVESIEYYDTEPEMVI